MKQFHLMLLCVANLFNTTYVHAATSPVGATQGQFQVSGSGAASYSIAIATPPGTAGMQPSLSFSYNSQGGNGQLGVGWSLGGLSVVTRCPQTKAQDGVRGAVKLDANDRFCLDGQRLIVTSGVYGAIGAEYRTEGESFSRIISYGTAGTGPAYFKIWTKSGQVMEYGNTTDSRIEAQGKTTVSVWALNKVQDSADNYLTVTYTEDNPNGQFYPTRVDYTGNASNGLTPYNSVQFIYEARPDITPMYHAGSLMKTAVRLKNVQSYTGVTLVKDYRLSYELSKTNQRSRALRLEECSGDGVCLGSTMFAWSDSSGLQSDGLPTGLPDTYISGGGKSMGTQMVDINGDGITDIVQLFLPPNGWYSGAPQRRVYLNTGKAVSYSNEYSASLPDAYFSGDGTDMGTRMVDVNGDGLADIVQLFLPTNGWYSGVPQRRIFLNTGKAFSYSSEYSVSLPDAYFSGGGTDMGTRILDVDGDGLTDIVQLFLPTNGWYSGVPQRRIFLNTGKAFSYSSEYSASLPDAYFSGGGTDMGTRMLDVDGDGLTDIVQLFLPTNSWYSGAPQRRVYLNTGKAFSYSNEYSASLSDTYFSGGGTDMGTRPLDVNGDGLTDIVQLFLPTNSWYSGVPQRRIYLNTGKAFSYSNEYSASLSDTYFSGGGTDMGTRTLDVNGDGLTDIVQLFIPTNSWYSGVPQRRIYLNTGKAFSYSNEHSASLSDTYFSGGGTDMGTELVDMAGSGQMGITQLFLSTNAWYGKVPQRRVFRVDGAPDHLTSLTTALGATTSITYKPLTDNSVYTKDTTSTYPTLDIQAPIYVVSSSSTSNGIGGNYSLNYKYAGMKGTQGGRGMLGFRTMETTDPQTGIVTHNEYRQDYPYTGLVSLSTKKINGTLLNQAQNTYTAVALGGTRYAVHLTKSVESSYELNGSLVTTVTTTNQYDAFANPTRIVVSTGDGYSKTTANTYTNDSTNWLLGRLTLASVTSTMPVTGSLTRTSSFAYNAVNGLLTQEVIEPNNVALRLQTDYTYDGYGNKLSVTVSGSGIASRTTTTVFDVRGQFPTKTTNALGHSDTGTYDARFGKALSLTGPNALATIWSYDGFGRKIKEHRADATHTTVAYKLCDATCPYFAKYYLRTTTIGSPISYAYFDMLNREIRVQTQGFNGRLITKDTYYDSFGRVDRVTKPYYAGDSPLYSYLAYDGLGRPIQETAPDNSIKQIVYNGLTTTVTNALAQRETKTKNSQGQLVSVTDNLNNVISYQYDPFGNLTKTTDPKGNQTTLTYDARGRKIGMIDPGMGSWTYTYNVLGELIQQKDAKNQIVNMSYDKLGRMLTRSEPDLNSTWVYDTATTGVGKLKQVSSDNGFLRVYTYDTLGRVSSETSSIDTTYNVAKTYGNYGRVATLTYPTGVAVKNIYNAYGYLSEVRNNATNALFWKANAKDADGHTLNETLGNGLTTTRTYTNSTGRVQAITTSGAATIQKQTFSFDSLGNLSARFDSVAGFTETFGYDGLNRLTTATQGATTTTVAYDSIGNITNKSNVGTYTYGAKPHAVTQVTGTLNASYTYDNNGNLTSGAGRTVTLTSYNLPSQITQGATSVNFIYDADHTRIKQTSATQTTIYLNPRIDAGLHFEKEVKGGVTENKHYIYGASGVVGVYTTSSAASPKTSYFHQDHLGSIVAVTNDAAVVVARYAFSTWGKRLVLAGSADATHHGFTGHEHLDEVGLVHMNGRVYDPVLGRFMSADPYIQAPDNLQSYNRYSYVWNNPLSATDPSGYFSLRRWAKAIALVHFAPTPKNYVNAIHNQPGQQYIDKALLRYPALAAVAQIAAGVYGGPGGAAAFSAYMTGLQGGSNFDIARAFTTSIATAAAFNVVGDLSGLENFLGHVAVGCLSAAAGGGSCKAGAASAGLANALGGGLEAHIIAGGVGAELGGGKFANGAITGAFGYLFNDCAHNECAALEKTKAFFQGAWSVATGTGNAIRFIARGTGLMGADEQLRWAQEAEAIEVFAEQYKNDPEFSRQVKALAVDTFKQHNNEEMKWSFTGRFSAGVLTSLGPAAFIGDTTRAVENGHGVVEALVGGGIGGRTKK